MQIPSSSLSLLFDYAHELLVRYLESTQFDLCAVRGHETETDRRSDDVRAVKKQNHRLSMLRCTIGDSSRHSFTAYATRRLFDISSIGDAAREHREQSVKLINNEIDKLYAIQTDQLFFSSMFMHAHHHREQLF